MQHDVDLLRDVAERFDLNFTAFGTRILTHDASATGMLTLDGANFPLEPAPSTPAGPEAIPWRILSGTIKATYNAHRGIKGTNNVIVSPSLVSYNTGKSRSVPSD